MLQKSLSGITHCTEMFKFFHNRRTVDMVDYFGSPEQPAQLQKTADEEFIPREHDLKKKKAYKAHKSAGYNDCVLILLQE